MFLHSTLQNDLFFTNGESRGLEDIPLVRIQVHERILPIPTANLNIPVLINGITIAF